jgi:peroxiredoxin
MKRFSAWLIALLVSLPAYAAAVEVGDQAPAFELASTRGGTIRLADFTGQKEVVLLFYPMDFTPT